MPGFQKSRRISRPASAKACCHSATGSAWNLARDRSTVTDSAEPWSSLCSDGRTRSSSWSLTTSRVPSPLTSNQSSSPTSSVTSRLRRSNRSRTGRGASSSGLAAPSPSTPATGSRSQASPPFTARSPRVPGLDHGDAHHAAGDTVGVDGYLGPFGVIVLVFVLVRLRRILAQRPAARQRAERRRGLRGQRHQVGAAAEGERQVEGLLVVHRVEAAPGDEGEVEAVGGEHRVGVGEPAVGHVDDLPAIRRSAPSGCGAAAAGRAGPRPARPSPATRTARRSPRRRTRPAR